MVRKAARTVEDAVDHAARYAEGGALPALQPRSREKRDRILKAAERVFAERGFWESHVSDIAREANCSVGSFYHRFRDKEGVFFDLQQHMYAQAHTNIDKFFANPIGETSPLTSVFFHLIENAAAEAIKIKGYFRALFEMSLRGRSVWAQMRELEIYQAQGFEALLRRRGVKDIRPDFVQAFAFAISMMTFTQISIMLHEPGLLAFNDPNATAELTRSLMVIAGVPIDEQELARLVASRKAPKRKPSST